MGKRNKVLNGTPILWFNLLVYLNKVEKLIKCDEYNFPVEDPVQALMSKLYATEFFSLQESRILAHLVVNPSLNTVKEICNELGIPDSKVYPALKILEEEELVYRNTSQRPARYLPPDPQKITEFLEDALTRVHHEKSQLIQEIDKQVSALWNPDEPSLGQIAYLFKGEAIKTEIRRMFKHIKHKVLLLLSPSSFQYSQLIEKEIQKCLNNGIKVEFAFPSQPQFAKVFQKLENLNNPRLQVKESIYSVGSYIVRDGNTMLNIMHRDRGDVALLTNDPLLVENIDGCFSDTSCCIPENPYDIQLNVLT
ncbi:MAG: TrmB family transcriptional regulator [Candidatus Kariarchaeaceae archaeon]